MDKEKDENLKAGGETAGGGSVPEGTTEPESSEEAGGIDITPARQQTSAPTEGGLVEKVVRINRVAKVVKGGKNFSFSAFVVAGDGRGHVGIGLGKSNEVVDAIRKGTSKAKSRFLTVVVDKQTIPHEVIGKFKSSKVLMKPAGPGTGVIAGGPVRALCDAAGIKNILTKTFGSRNAANVVKAAINGFSQLKLKRRGQ